MKNAVLALMFLLELGVIAGAATWGFTVDAGWGVRIVAGVVAPALFIMMWALFGAARDARFRLRGGWRVVLELIWFGGGAIAWAVALSSAVGVIFFALWVIDAVGRYLVAGDLIVEITGPQPARRS